MKQEERLLMTPMTEADFVEYGQELAHLEASIIVKRDEAKRSAKGYKELVSAMQSQIDNLVMCINEKQHMAEILCELRGSTWYRTDTDEAVAISKEDEADD